LKRVLLVTYYFPPSGGPGVQRALKFARYLPEYGWEPVVLTVRSDRAAYPDVDDSLLREIPETLRVERTGAWDPYGFYARLLGKKKRDTVGVGFVGEGTTNRRQRFGRWIRANLFLPDARIGWIPYARARARKLLSSEPFDAIITSGPPHSSHFIGRHLSRNIPWLADFRDPWTNISYYDELPHAAWARALDARMERCILNDANQIVTVSPALKQLLVERGRAPIEVIPNGFDPSDFQDGPIEESPDEFVVAHVGNLSASQNPVVLWEVLRALDASRTMPELRLRFTGNVDPTVFGSLDEYGLTDLIETTPYVPHEEAIRRMKSAALLLLCINNVPDADGIVTGKIYEYIAAHRPVLGIGPVCGDAGRILTEVGGGTMFDHGDVDGVTAAIRQYYVAWRGGLMPRGASYEATAQYDRKKQTGVLAELLDSMISQ